MIFLENEQDFFELIKNKLVLVDFYATWCGPCRMISPIIDEVAKETTDLMVVKVDVDKYPNIATKYGIMSIPTLKVFKNGKEEKTSIGYIEKDAIKDLLK
ncbi:thioredoxin [Mycoplasma sp. CAG:877]|nr:thioredoxin [Mycoplasma sp. CAG:877]